MYWLSSRAHSLLWGPTDLCRFQVRLEAWRPTCLPATCCGPVVSTTCGLEWGAGKAELQETGRKLAKKGFGPRPIGLFRHRLEDEDGGRISVIEQPAEMSRALGNGVLSFLSSTAAPVSLLSRNNPRPRN